MNAEKVNRFSVRRTGHYVLNGTTFFVFVGVPEGADRVSQVVEICTSLIEQKFARALATAAPGDVLELRWGSNYPGNEILEGVSITYRDTWAR